MVKKNINVRVVNDIFTSAKAEADLTYTRSICLQVDALVTKEGYPSIQAHKVLLRALSDDPFKAALYKGKMGEIEFEHGNITGAKSYLREAVISPEIKDKSISVMVPDNYTMLALCDLIQGSPSIALITISLNRINKSPEERDASTDIVHSYSQYLTHNYDGTLDSTADSIKLLLNPKVSFPDPVLLVHNFSLHAMAVNMLNDSTTATEAFNNHMLHLPGDVAQKVLVELDKIFYTDDPAKIVEQRPRMEHRVLKLLRNRTYLGLFT